MLEQPLLPGSKESAGTEWPRPRLSSPHPFHPVPISDSPVPLPTLPHLGFWTLGFWFSADSPLCASVFHLWTDGVGGFQTAGRAESSTSTPQGAEDHGFPRYQHPGVIVCEFSSNLDLGLSNEQEEFRN